MSHRLPDLTSADLRVVSRWLDDDGSLRILREPSSADLTAVIRAGVESGTIKGEVVEWCEAHRDVLEVRSVHGTPMVCAHAELLGFDNCKFVSALVIPVSDGGSET